MHFQIDTRDRARELLALGHGRLEVARLLGLSKSTVSYHARRLGLPIDEKCTRRYDWAAIQAYYDEGHTVSDCQEAFGFARETWNQARRRGDVRPRPRAMPIDALLASKRNRTHLKLRLVKAGLKENRCESCGVVRWLDRSLSLELHHINGDGDDNRLDNLRILCPNCHSQTDSWGGRNIRRVAA